MSETSGSSLQRQTIEGLRHKVLLPDEVARRLRTTKTDVVNQARNGKLPGAFKLGARYRFHADRVEAWFQGWWDPPLPGSETTESDSWNDYVASLRTPVADD